MTYLSYSSIKLLNDCHACFWWQVKKGIRRLNAWQSNLPNVVESQILKKFEDYRKDGKLPPEFDVNKYPELKGFKLIDTATHNKWKDVRSGEPNYQNLTANPDDALIKDGKIIIIDIKTMGSFCENISEKSMLEDIENYSYKLQLEFYTYILKMSGKNVADYGYILFYYVGGMNGNNELSLKHNLIKVNIDLSSIPPLVKKAEEILKRESPPECRCDFCSSSKDRYKDFQEKQKKQDKLISEMVKI